MKVYELIELNGWAGDEYYQIPSERSLGFYISQELLEKKNPKYVEYMENKEKEKKKQLEIKESRKLIDSNLSENDYNNKYGAESHNSEYFDFLKVREMSKDNFVKLKTKTFSKIGNIYTECVHMIEEIYNNYKNMNNKEYESFEKTCRTYELQDDFEELDSDYELYGPSGFYVKTINVEEETD